MIDFHTHILHGIDDGSDCIETSLKMLKEEYKQGVERVVLTPHFYATKSIFSVFLAERENKFLQLKNFIEKEDDIPKLSLGAEVAFFAGMSDCEQLKKLCIADSEYILVEMPYAKWDKKTVNDVLRIGENLNLTVILAHINRYFCFKNGNMIKLLAENGINMQLNSECVFDKKMKKESYKLLSEQSISFIGSDCHNLNTRAPNLIKLKEAIVNDFGEEYFNEIDFFQKRIFED